jgi:hypothetical protein
MKEPTPIMDLELSDMPDLKGLADTELKKVPFERRKLLCSVNGCSRFTHVKDYGISPEFYAFGSWNDLSQTLFFCPKHWKEYKAANRNGGIFEYKEGPAINHIK